MSTLLLLPRNAVVAFLVAYRRIISPLYGDVCRYHPSCSAYALQSVQLHGVLVGSWWTARRLLRCHPWATGGIDDVRPRRRFRYLITPAGFVVAGHQKG
ncbi:membrane protein insertion efficiency factor YidD [Mycetocola reblochoni]|uniref:Putative membrane protein insertion efficiency factor n=2 Tax=Mycetocola reblochoni TaxID=331618 RepID=A0A1R4JFY5_9MICO|nr:membrane protein insertion efficiency factor YidD [Mycetocola reblochoni]RLP67742.1 membrane protein insertion efficiency factor YidD [Mycetocola reblochoni]SJN30705.1 Protein YidD [Mycetocola reblochoni REB411]